MRLQRSSFPGPPEYLSGVCRTENELPRVWLVCGGDRRAALRDELVELAEYVGQVKLGRLGVFADVATASAAADGSAHSGMVKHPGNRELRRCHAERLGDSAQSIGDGE